MCQKGMRLPLERAWVVDVNSNIRSKTNQQDLSNGTRVIEIGRAKVQKLRHFDGKIVWEWPPFIRTLSNTIEHYIAIFAFPCNNIKVPLLVSGNQWFTCAIVVIYVTSLR